MVYGIIGLINFAHGDVAIGAMAATTIAISLVGGDPRPRPSWCWAWACWCRCRCAWRSAGPPNAWPTGRCAARRLAALITAIGVSIILQNVAMMGWAAIT